MLKISIFRIFLISLIVIQITLKGFASNFILNTSSSFKVLSDTSFIEGKFIKSKKYLVYSDSIKIGINGHPLTQEAYLEASLDSQVNLIKELNLNYYRIDLVIDEVGNLQNEVRFQELVRKAKNKNIEILPVLINSGWEKEIKQQNSYLLGQKIGAKFALTYKSNIEYYEIGNEDDSKLMSAKDDGSLTEHYDLTKLKKLINYYKGVIKGIKTEDKNAQIIISSSGWLHLGFFKLLEEANVNYDILGYHWYSDMGDLKNDRFNILDSLDKFNKPIWFTEINRRNGSKEGAYTGNTSFKESESKEVAQSQWIKRYIEQLCTKSNVRAIFIYELFDEPAFDDSKGFEAPHEAYFGLVNWEKRYSQVQRKTAYFQLKAKNEEMHHGLQDFINMVFKNFKDRKPNSEEYKQILADLHHKDFELVIKDLYKELVLKKLIVDKYKSLLNRDPELSEIKYWLNLYNDRDIIKNIILTITLSDEFWNLVGNTNIGFIKILYLTLQKREADINGETYWMNFLEESSNKRFVVESLLESEEYIDNSIIYNFEKLISKEIDSSFLINKVHNNRKWFSEYRYILDLVSSKYYWDKALRYGCEKRNNPFCYID